MRRVATPRAPRRTGKIGPRRLENRSVKVKNFVSRVSISRSVRRRDGRGVGNLCVTGGLSPSATLAATSGCGRGDCGSRNHCSKSPEARRCDGHSLTHGRAIPLPSIYLDFPGLAFSHRRPFADRFRSRGQALAEGVAFR